MQVRAKYVTEFTVRKGKLASSRVIGEEVASNEQKAAILAIKPMLQKFVKSRLRDNIQIDDCTVNVKVTYIETTRGLEINFRV